MRQSEKTKVTFVSCGEPTGIGPDIALLAWRAMSDGNVATESFIYVGDLPHLQSRADQLGITVPLSLFSEDKKFEDSLSVYPLKNPIVGTTGNPIIADQPAVLESIETSVRLVQEGQGSSLVTLPVHKKTLYDSGFTYEGHTQYLAHLADNDSHPVMMLVGSDLRTVPVTIHIPLIDIANTLTTDLIVRTSRIVARELKTRFGISNPKLAFSGLNPHAGEGGSLGMEETDIIEPALTILRNDGIDCLGILSADTMFHASARKKYDVAICMYHDQALIPSKTLSFHDGVNVTLGLPFIRTSPDHGTALDIAGSGDANPASFISALRIAREMSQSQSSFEQTSLSDS